jgi:hypothetical protein
MLRSPAQRIPVSPTGYRSHFAPPGELDHFDGPEAHAEAIARAIIREKSGMPCAEEHGQGALF